jgi:hypothetical protein
MNQVIVTTTIHAPTEALRRFTAMQGWKLVVVGDKKTPREWHLPGAIYISPEEQELFDKKLSDAIGWNCIQRRNFGLLWAHDMGADIVAVVDDDNIPYEGWGENLLIGREIEVNYYTNVLPAFDPVGATNYGNLWHRGFPLPLLAKRDYSRLTHKRILPDVQADFWNGDPDIDAICRMQYGPECRFEERFFPLSGTGLAPFNSQNTFLAGSILKDYFLFPKIGRMDDIWAAYYVQAKGVCVVYGKASVYQQRNVHDLVGDMRQEYLGYEHNLNIVQALPNNPAALVQFLPQESIRAWELYLKHFQ